MEERIKAFVRLLIICFTGLSGLVGLMMGRLDMVGVALILGATGLALTPLFARLWRGVD